MYDIKITFQELADKTAQVRSHNTKLDDLLHEIKNTINALESDYTSDTSDTIRNGITGLEPKFKSYYEAIESYAKFLDNVITSWRLAEDTINKGATELANSAGTPSASGASSQFTP